MKKNIMLYALIGCCALYSALKADCKPKTKTDACFCQNRGGNWDSNAKICKKNSQYCENLKGVNSEFLPSLDICSNPNDDTLTCQYQPADCWYKVCIDRHEGTQKAAGDYNSGSPLDITNKKGCCELKYGEGKWDDTNKKCNI